MDERGITLMEIIVVVSVIGILTAAGGFTYADWMKKYRIESTARELYADLMRARVLSMDKNLRHFAVLESDSYSIIEDTNGDGVDNEGDTVLPLYPKRLLHTLNWNGTGNKIYCDKRGLLSPLKTLWLTVPDEPLTGSDYDCMKVSRTRIILGQYNGTDCTAK